MGILRTDRVSGLGGANAIKGSVFLCGGDDSSGSQTMNMKDSSLAIGTNEFCCDFWMYWVDIPSHGVRVVGNINQGDYSTAQSWAYLRFADGTSRLWNGSSWVSTGADNFVAGRWYHIAIIRNSGNNQGLYIDGSLQSTTVSNTNNWTNDEFDINGRASDGAESGRIFFSNVRLTIGSGASELGGIVPVGESEVLADTKILCCNSPGNVLNESAQGIPITTGRNSTANASVGTASRFTPNSPVGSSTTTDVGTQFGTTFDGVTTFDSQAYFVPPGGNTRERNRGRGLFAGGDAPIGVNISSIEIQSQGNATDFGDLTSGRLGTGAVGSSTRGVISSGYAQPSNANTNIIDFVTIANASNATDFGDSTQARHESGASSSQTRGLFGGGTSPSLVDTIDFVTIATTGNATDFGNLTQGRRNVTGVSSPTRSVFVGGRISGPTESDVIDFVTIASTGDATDFGDLTDARGRSGSVCSNTRGVVCGGETPSAVNTIDFITIASAGNATDFGDCITTVSQGAGGASNNTRGAFLPSYIAPAYTNAIQFVTIATTGNALDFGDNTVAGGRSYGFSDSHGGLE